MAEKVWITITGIQKGIQEEPPVVLQTEGQYIKKGNTHYLFYTERTEEGVSVKNRLTVAPDYVELRKSGMGDSILKFREGRAEQCRYQSPAGPMEMVSTTQKIQISHRNGCFKLSMVYALHMNDVLVSDYHLSAEARFFS